MGKSKTIVGLDIGSHSVKAVVLEPVKSGLVLKNIGMAQLPPEAIVEGAIQEQEIVVTAIKNLLKYLKVGIKNVCTSISGYSVIIKKINLPTATREELSESIEVEAEQFIPFDISEVNVDFQIVGQSETDDEQMEVILVAAKKDVIDVYIKLLMDAGLKPTIIDVDVFALENAFTHSHPDVEGTVALVDIGANKMNINVIKDGLSLLTKDAALGGARVTGEIQDRFDVDYKTAEDIKVGAKEAPDEEGVRQVVSRAVENWVAEAKRTVDYLEASYPGEHLKEIYLSGGSSHIKGLVEYFQQELKVPVKILNPFKKIIVDQKLFDPAYIEYIGPQATICLGLALRRGEEL
ncbi:MAG: type IV pilus assembly protein PilM [Thermodesulfobacteriota bacterium]